MFHDYPELRGDENSVQVFGHACRGVSQKEQVLGGSGGKSEKQARQMKRQVYFYDKKIMLDKICYPPFLCSICRYLECRLWWQRTL